MLLWNQVSEIIINVSLQALGKTLNGPTTEKKTFRNNCQVHQNARQSSAWTSTKKIFILKP